MDIQGPVITDEELEALINEPIEDLLKDVDTSADEIYTSSRYRKGEKQEKKTWCGPFTDKQLIYKLYGILVDQSYLAEKAGTGAGGTSHEGMLAALTAWSKKINIKNIPAEFVAFNTLTWKSLGQKLIDPNTAIGFHVLYRDKWGHYMVLVYVNITKRIVGLLDSLNPHQDIVYVNFAEFEKWIHNTPGGQKSVEIVQKK